jgi:predicted anti-sigma-YlaC factor YlaD
MMECYIVRDLLPGVADGLVSSETQRDVLAHLEHCPDCRLRYEQMKRRWPPRRCPAGKRKLTF